MDDDYHLKPVVCRMTSSLFWWYLSTLLSSLVISKEPQGLLYRKRFRTELAQKKKKRQQHYFIINQFENQYMKEDLSVLKVTCEPKLMFSNGKETKTAFFFFNRLMHN